MQKRRDTAMKLPVSSQILVAGSIATLICAPVRAQENVWNTVAEMEAQDKSSPFSPLATNHEFYEKLQALYSKLIFLEADGRRFEPQSTTRCTLGELSPDKCSCAPIGDIAEGRHIRPDEIIQWQKSKTPVVPYTALSSLRLKTLGDRPLSYLSVFTDDARDLIPKEIEVASSTVELSYATFRPVAVSKDGMLSIKPVATDRTQVLWAIIKGPGDVRFKEYFWLFEPAKGATISSGNKSFFANRMAAAKEAYKAGDYSKSSTGVFAALTELRDYRPEVTPYQLDSLDQLIESLASHDDLDYSQGSFRGICLSLETRIPAIKPSRIIKRIWEIASTDSIPDACLPLLPLMKQATQLIESNPPVNDVERRQQRELLKIYSDTLQRAMLFNKKEPDYPRMRAQAKKLLARLAPPSAHH